MSLKRRNLIAWLLLLAAAISWSTGRSLGGLSESIGAPAATTPPGYWAEETVSPATASGDKDESKSILPTEPYHVLRDIYPGVSAITARASSPVLTVLAAVLAVVGIFTHSAIKPISGPDGSLLLLALISIGTRASLNHLNDGTPEDILAYAVKTFLFLACLRELWSWLRAGFPADWYLENRIVKRIHKPQAALLVMGAWLVCLTILTEVQFTRFELLSCLLLAGPLIMGGGCLWHYGSCLQHFKTQLNHFQQGTAIEVHPGAMEAAEQQLLTVQNQHREAVKTAVASERFKVDLFSNVSHDLRTPLTAIVGDGELLKGETLSEEGTRQLDRLNQKAGYMRELVDSLFELTKVSSGVLECKKEKIDLIRLLEQTIGLMDDQLSMAGLTVKRHYPKDALPLVTDGSRMHQVISNLLGNAIKYALPGTRIHLEVKQTEEGYTVRMVNTASYDMDFEAEDILHRFVRGDKARSTQGSGLGLAIAQTYTESVGGSFRVSVDADQFSAIVTFPEIVRKL